MRNGDAHHSHILSAYTDEHRKQSPDAVNFDKQSQARRQLFQPGALWRSRSAKWQRVRILKLEGLIVTYRVGHVTKQRPDRVRSCSAHAFLRAFTPVSEAWKDAK